MGCTNSLVSAGSGKTQLKKTANVKINAKTSLTPDRRHIAVLAERLCKYVSAW